MEQAEHIINRVIFDFELNNSKEALEVQKKVSLFGKNDLPTILNSLFDEYSFGNRTLSLEKMEINLGNVDPDDFPDRYLEKLINQLRQKLNEISSEQLGLVDIKKIEEDEELRTLNPSENGEILSKEQKDFIILRDFLLTGSLPWFCQPGQVKLNEVIRNLVAIKHQQFIQFIKENIKKHSFRQRIIYQFEEPDILNLIINVYGDKFEQLKMLVQNLQNLYEQNPFVTTSERDFNYLLFNNVFETVVDSQPYFKISVNEQFLFLLALRTGNNYREFICLINENIKHCKAKGTACNNKFETDISSYLESLKEDFEVKWKRYSSSAEDDQCNFGPIQEIEVNDVLHEKPSQSIVQLEKEKIISEGKQAGYYISNAGLVLLNPFIPELFKKLKYVNRGEFKNEEAVHKAIHILQYAVSKKMYQSESLLILNKILCGLSIEESIRLKVELSRSEKAEATRMVNAALKHWNALKSTSDTSFRNSFLNRNGLLKLSGKKWKLFVERKPYDVLLDRIPWAYRMFQYSWMDKKIEVEW